MTVSRVFTLLTLHASASGSHNIKPKNITDNLFFLQ